ARQSGYTWGQAQSLRQLGMAAQRLSDSDRAIELIEASLLVYARAHTMRGSDHARHDLGVIYLAKGDHRRAAVLLADSLDSYRAAGDRYSIARCLETLAGTALMPDTRIALAQAVEAARLLGSASALRGVIKLVVAPVEQPAIQRTIAA